ncbi:hypothetical protein, partial [uncultured Parabacteroides sp.]|uniref:hypothetical protein n=1 Tax=uncultured Parabacteroides sp. TaxID=512312 RepID=UPI00266B7451
MKGKRRCDCLSPLPGDESPGKRKSNEREKEDVIVSLLCQGINPPAKEKAMKGKRRCDCLSPLPGD